MRINSSRIRTTVCAVWWTWEPSTRPEWAGTSSLRWLPPTSSDRPQTMSSPRNCTIRSRGGRKGKLFRDSKLVAGWANSVRKRRARNSESYSFLSIIYRGVFSTGSRSPSDNGGGSNYDSDSMRSRCSDRPRVTDAHFGLKRLMDDLGRQSYVKLQLEPHSLFCVNPHFGIELQANIRYSCWPTT